MQIFFKHFSTLTNTKFYKQEDNTLKWKVSKNLL